MKWPKFRTNTAIENTAKRIFDLCMQGVITKEDGLSELFIQHTRARDGRVKDRIFNQIKHIWENK